MNKFIRRALIILGLPNSLYLCLRTMPLKKAIRCPIIVSPFTRFLSLSGTIKVNEEKFGSVRMGFDGLAVAYSKPICIENDGNIFIGGHVNFGGGCQLSCRNGANLSIGTQTKIMGEAKIFCSHHIEIGSGCRVSWNTQIIDTDFHEIRNVDNELLNPPAPVIIHDNCWLCSGVKIYKGVEIYQGCVIAGDASICKSVNEPNAVVTGMPIRYLRREIQWIP